MTNDPRPENARPAGRPLEHALDVMAVGAVVVDAEGCIVFANAHARRLLGDAPEGARLADRLDAPGLADLAAAAAEDEPVRVAPGEGRPLEVTARALGTGGFVLSLEPLRGDGLDPLTGLPNRGRLLADLAAALARSGRTGVPLAVLMIDLDRFKAVNDTLGHPVGDALLVKVAERMRHAVREGDLVARVGGDEFVVVQSNAGPPQAAEALARRLVDLVGRSYVVEGHLINIGTSIGIAMAPADGDDVARLVRSADLALYRAKAGGRGTFRFYEPEMDAQAQERRALEADLRKALALRQFHIEYQPLIRLDTEGIVGFEALLRWTNPNRGLVPPLSFIPIAEEIGLIGPIGEWVLATACSEAATWREPVSLAVNVSPAQFRSGDLAGAVARALDRSGLAPERLEIEITETVLIENTEIVLSVLNRLRAFGVRVSMDDFGTGYSSLSYLRKFPFDKIKIDQSFVRNIHRDSDSRAIVRAVAGLGASLGIETLAEGVETLEQLAQIRADGCSGVQGFLTGRPVRAEAVAGLLAPGAALKGEAG